MIFFFNSLILLAIFDFHKIIAMSQRWVFPEVRAAAGDLVFFYRSKNGRQKIAEIRLLRAQKDGLLHKVTEEDDEDDDPEKRESICAVADKNFVDVFHVGIIVKDAEGCNEDGAERIVHAADEKVRVDLLADVVADMLPARVDLCRVGAPPSAECAADDAASSDAAMEAWRRRAVAWALQQRGAAYNDAFSPECVNSRGERAFYCCQLVVEAYKATNELNPGESPFLPHILSFAGPDGQLLPFWTDYYRKLCPANPHPPHGKPGSHPSKLRASPRVSLIAAKCDPRID